MTVHFLLTCLAMTLVDAAASSLSAVEPVGGPAPGGGPAQAQFDHFIYLRHDNDRGAARTDSLVLVKVTGEGVAARPAYSKNNLHVDWHPLCVRGGKLYGITIGTLVAIDLAKGVAEELGHGLESFTCLDGRLYAFARAPESGLWLREYDLGARAFRNVARWTNSSWLGWRPPPLRVSPDLSHVAWFAASNSSAFSRSYYLSMADTTTGAIQRCGEGIPAREFMTGGGTVADGPPFAWRDAATILVVRDLSKNPLSMMRINPMPGQARFGPFNPEGGAPEMILASLDTTTGQTTDLVRLPRFEPEIGEPCFRPPDEAGAPRLVLGRLGQYRLDLAARRLLEDNGLAGGYRYQQGGDPEELFYKTTLLESGQKIPQVAVSPDGRRIAWEVWDRVRRSEASVIRVHDAASSTKRTVATEWIPGSWDSRQRSFQGNLLWVSSQDLAPAAPAALAAGWTRCSSQPYPAPPTPYVDTRKNMADRLALHLGTDRPVYRLHEPVRLTVTLTNKSDQDVIFKRPTGYGSFFHLSVRSARLQSMISEFDHPEQTFPADPVQIKAGQQWEQTHLLELCEPGQYQLSGSFGVQDEQWQGQAAAEPLVFIVQHSPEDQRLFQEQFARFLEACQREFAKDPMTCDYGRFLRLGPASVPALLAVLEDAKDPKFRARLGYAVERMATPEVLPYCSKLLGGDMNEDRPLLLESLSHIFRYTPAKDGALDLLLLALRHQNISLRRETAALLKTISHPRVAEAFRTAVNDDDPRTSLLAARYLAAAEDKNLGEWLAATIAEPSKARYIAAQDIVRELQTKWHQDFGPMPGLSWEELSKAPAELEAVKNILRRWQQWAAENPRSAAAFFDAERQGWIR
jgi:hypothetical protein